MRKKERFFDDDGAEAAAVGREGGPGGTAETAASGCDGVAPPPPPPGTFLTESNTGRDMSGASPRRITSTELVDLDGFTGLPVCLHRILP